MMSTIIIVHGFLVQIQQNIQHSTYNLLSE